MNNSPAFPRPFSRSELRQEGYDEQEGMTLRDYFAAKALQGMLSDNGCAVASEIAKRERTTELKAITSYAWKLADAMLKAREQ